MVEPDRGSGDRRRAAEVSSRNAPGPVNYHSTNSPKDTTVFNKRTAFRDNAAALDILYQLEQEKRNATPGEQAQLAKYVGFGGLKEILLNPQNPAEWVTQSDIALKPFVEEIHRSFDRLDPDGSQGLLAGAKRSILNAHYTAYPIINAVWEAVRRAGFRGGNILEPAAGIGNFLAAMPPEIANHSQVTAIEMDGATGKLLQRLFPTAETHITAFEKIALPENHYDLVISNVPFGNVAIYDSQLAKHRDKRYHGTSDNIHNFFFAKSILLAKPGAMLALITSRYTLDSTRNSGIRALMNDTCAFIGAVRLPDTAFRGNAGTEVVVDLILLQKNGPGRQPSRREPFGSTVNVPVTDTFNNPGTVTYNEYYHNNPGHLLGEIAVGGLYGADEFNLKGDPQTDLQAAITDIAAQIIPNPILQDATVENRQAAAQRASALFTRLGEFDSIGNIVSLGNNQFGVITPELYVNEENDEKARSLGLNPDNIRASFIRPGEEAALMALGLTVEDFQLKVVAPLKPGKAELPKLKYIEPLRTLTKELLFRELNDHSDFSIEKTREALNEAYRNFTFRFGNLLDPINKKALSLDTDCYLIQSLEKKDRLTGKITTADILSTRTIRPAREITKTDSVQDAITVSLEKYGGLQMNFITELMGKSYGELMAAQTGEDCLIFVDGGGRHVTRDEYLSGNVVAKLAEAELNGWESNALCLRKVQPEPIVATDIYSPLHARWLPRQYLHDFLKDTCKTASFDLQYSKSTDQYTLKMEAGNAATESFATHRRSAAWVFTHALNGVEPVVTYTEKDEQGRERTLLDAQDTQFAKEQYRKVRDGWDAWKFLDSGRREDIASLYNARFNNTVLRRFDGSHLTLPGLLGYTPRAHQKDAVFRNVQAMGGINDHMVGAGKTLIQICTAMELRRLGIAGKPLITGLKSQVPQLYMDFKKAYPLAKVLFPTERDFSRDNRNRLLNNIATNDWDCIILSHDQFNMIRQPADIQKALISELMATLQAEIGEAEDKKQKKVLEARLYKYQQKMDALLDSKKDSQVLDFSQLGIDFLMVDESQEYKNLEFITQKRNVRGLGNPAGSKKAFNLLIACRHLQGLHKGDRGILFCSGTPISNTMAELYLLMKYLRPNKLQELRLTSFDRWAANFANDYSELEYHMGKFKEVHRFREFANLPELLTMYREIADVRNAGNLQLERPKANHSLVKIAPSETQTAQIEKLQQFIASKGIDYAAELGLTAGYDAGRKMNPSYAILAINYAKKLSLDPRLINPGFPPGTKLAAAAENIAGIYEKSTHFKGTQLVFCDIGTPKSDHPADNLYNYLENAGTTEADLKEIFGEGYHEATRKPALAEIAARTAEVLNITHREADNLVAEANTAENFNAYAEVKRLLVAKGIPSAEIAFIHDYNTRQQKTGLFRAVNAGEIRIVLGSTKKLGTGVNVQERCIAGHHLDISWRPSDIEQRNGRLERQGNLAASQFNSNSVDCFYYATERTLDASMYQTVSLKAQFIAQLKTTGDPSVRTLKDIEEDIDMGSMAAELSGDPIFREKASLQKRVSELAQLQKSFLQKRFNTEDSLRYAKGSLVKLEERISALEKNIPLLAAIQKDKDGNPVFTARAGNADFNKVSDFGTAMLIEAEKALRTQPTGRPFLLGELWGFRVMGTVKAYFSGKEVSRVVTAPDGTAIENERELPEGGLAAALQVKQAILEMPDRLLKAQNQQVVTENNIASYEQQLKESFPYGAELAEKKERLSEVDKIIILKNKIEEPDNSTGKKMKR